MAKFKVKLIGERTVEAKNKKEAIQKVFELFELDSFFANECKQEVEELKK